MFATGGQNSTFTRDMEEFATSIHTDITIAVGRTINPAERGLNILAFQVEKVASETTPTAAIIFQMWWAMSKTTDAKRTRTVVVPESARAIVVEGWTVSGSKSAHARDYFSSVWVLHICI